MGDLITSFAQGIPHNTLTQFGSTLANIAQQRKAAQLKQEQEWSYQNALTTYMRDQTPENRVAVLEAGRPLGIFDQTEKEVQGYDTAKREADARQLAGALGPLYAGDNAMAAQTMRSYADAYANSGDQKEAAAWNALAQDVENGESKKVMATLALQGSFSEEGKRVLDNLLSLQTSDRESMRATSDFIDSAVKREFSSPEEQARQRELASQMPNRQLAQLSIDMGHVASALEDGSMNANNVNSAVGQWANFYQQGTSNFRQINESAAKVRQAAYTALLERQKLGVNPNTASNVGIADNTLINSFQRLIDPATVRQSDIDLIKSATGFGEEALTKLRGLRSGDMISDAQRRAMLTISEQLIKQYKQEEEAIYGVVKNNADAIEKASGQTDVLPRIVSHRLFGRTEADQVREIKDALIAAFPDLPHNEEKLSDFDPSVLALFGLRATDSIESSAKSQPTTESSSTGPTEGDF